MKAVLGGEVVYRADRARSIVGALFLLIPSALAAARMYWDIRERDIGQFIIALLLIGLMGWMDVLVVMKVLWPPEVRIGTSAFTYTNRALLLRGATYRWDELEGPTETVGSGGVPLLQMVVKSTTKKLRFPPSHFGANYDEMAAVIEAAQRGHIIDPAEWRTSHPRFSLPGWLLPLLMLVGISVGLLWAFGFLDPYVR